MITDIIIRDNAKEFIRYIELDSNNIQLSIRGDTNYCDRTKRRIKKPVAQAVDCSFDIISPDGDCISTMMIQNRIHINISKDSNAIDMFRLDSSFICNMVEDSTVTIDYNADDNIIKVIVQPVSNLINRGI